MKRKFRLFKGVLKRVPLLLILFFGGIWLNGATAMTVGYSGCVTEKKVIFEMKQSILTLIKQAELKPCAYRFATALIQIDQIKVQTVQKFKLLTQLQHLLTLHTDSEALKEYLTTLIVLIENQPVTGRVLGQELDATRVEIIPLQNRVFQTDLVLHFPGKLKSVYFVGTELSVISYRSSWTLDRYLKETPLLDFLEKGYVHVVQANTSIEKRKVGYWNHNDYYPSPGAWVVGLFKPALISEVAPALNDDLAQWLATQVLR